MIYIHPATDPIQDAEYIITQLLPAHYQEAKRVAKIFRGMPPKTLAKAIHSWLGETIQYEADDVEETIRTPSSLLSRGSGDCEDVALLVSSILVQLHLPHNWIVCDYGNGFEHVYISYNNQAIDFTRPFNRLLEVFEIVTFTIEY